MVDCLTLCNTGCITCVWCLLLSFCFPRYFNNFEDTDSNKCTFKPVPKPPQYCKLNNGSKKLRRRTCSAESNCINASRSCFVLKTNNCQNKPPENPFTCRDKSRRMNRSLNAKGQSTSDDQNTWDVNNVQNCAPYGSQLVPSETKSGKYKLFTRY